ncbi:hypothetical protein [Alkalihalobacillus sp. CinArs1]|uniref:hypothetical protein n=1 Tax=Alkalihalobacillus sp. CinArs1 TaxID=2995314 RepID=UPI0022DDA20D|nr:hypothetical protein [Alkalihalobacillus sp. CinArs1]
MKLRVTLIILTLVSMSAMVWAGFTRQSELFPLLLSITIAFSMANISFDKKKEEREKTIYKVAMSLAIFAAILSAGNFFF